MSILVLILAAIFSVLLPTAIILMAGQRSMRSWIYKSLPLFLILGLNGRTFVSGRNLTFYSLDTNSILGGDTAAADWISRIANASILFSAAVLITGTIIGRFRARRVAPPDNNRGLIFFLIFFVGTVLSPAFLAPHAEFRVNATYVVMVFVALLLALPSEAETFLRGALIAAVASICVALLSAIFIPKLSLQPGYQSIFSWFNYRLWGLDAHANSLGPLAAVTFLLLLWVGPSGLFEKASLLGISLIVLFMTQSKTAILSLAGALMVRGALTVVSKVKASGDLTSIRLRVSLIWVSVVLVSVAIISTFLLQQHTLEYTGSRSTLYGSAVENLTGRERIWLLSIEEFIRSPITGYGSKLWGPEFSAPLGLLGVATTGHNQLIDALGTSGLIGGFATVAYLSYLGYFAFKSAVDVKDYTVAIFAFLFFRSITEVPFRIQIMLSSDVLIHLVLISGVVLCRRRLIDAAGSKGAQQ